MELNSKLIVVFLKVQCSQEFFCNLSYYESTRIISIKYNNLFELELNSNVLPSQEIMISLSKNVIDSLSFEFPKCFYWYRYDFFLL